MRIISFAKVIKQLPEDQHSFSIIDLSNLNKK